MARKKKPEEHVNHERWLVSYADFITLLFATFTALFAISNADMEKFKKLANSVSEAFHNDRSGIPTIGVEGGASASDALVISIFDSSASGNNPKSSKGGEEPGGEGGELEFDPVSHLGHGITTEEENLDEEEGLGQWVEEDPEGLVTPTPTPEPTPEPDGGAGQDEGGAAAALGDPEGQASDQMVHELKTLLDQAGLEGKVQVRKEARGTVISLGEAAFFAPGGIDVLPRSIHQLDQILNTLRGRDFEIRVEGHTDDTPVSPGRPYRDNMELSAMRAARVVEFMIREYDFPPMLISSAGFGEWRPVAPNDAAEDRQKNRRVDIVILNQAERAKEPR